MADNRLTRRRAILDEANPMPPPPALRTGPSPSQISEALGIVFDEGGGKPHHVRVLLWAAAEANLPAARSALMQQPEVREGLGLHEDSALGLFKPEPGDLAELAVLDPSILHVITASNVGSQLLERDFGLLEILERYGTQIAAIETAEADAADVLEAIATGFGDEMVAPALVLARRRQASATHPHEFKEVALWTFVRALLAPQSESRAFSFRSFCTTWDQHGGPADAGRAARCLARFYRGKLSLKALGDCVSEAELFALAEHSTNFLDVYVPLFEAILATWQDHLLNERRSSH